MIIYNVARLPIKSWCTRPEAGAYNQAIDLANHKAVFHHVSLMPDTHQGMGMCIGGVVGLKNALSPVMVGVDIACGMLSAKLSLDKDVLSTQILKDIVHDIKRTIPMGFNHQKDNKWKQHAQTLITNHPGLDENIVTCESIYSQLGTLGGGNHFIEFQTDEMGCVWVMIHSGSRNLGHKIATKYDRLAKRHPGAGNYPNTLVVLPDDSVEGQEYFKHMKFCIDFSFKNRECMLEDILDVVQRHAQVSKNIRPPEQIVNIHHNYANKETHFGEDVWVHRKGATSAKLNQLGVIPGSMGDKSYMVSGLGNPESFESCSHGAGRKMSRTQAKSELSEEEFGEIMKGIVSEDVNKNHLDESPMAYKDIDTVMYEQQDLVKVVHTFTPIANVKG